MELKKITEEVNALTEQFPCFWSQFEIDESESHSSSHTSLSHTPFLGNNPFFSSHPPLLSSHHYPQITPNYEMPDASSSSEKDVHMEDRSPSLSLETIQLHHIRCRYIERGKHFELSWSCPSMANYTWLVEPSDMDPRCLNRIRDGPGSRHGRNVERNPPTLSHGDSTMPVSPFRLKAEIGIDTSDGWIPLQQCCPQCSGPLVLFASSSTRLSEQGHGRIVAQVHFTKTHGGRAATCRVGLRLKCVTVDPSTSGPSSSGPSSSSVHVEHSSSNVLPLNVNINPIVLPSPHLLNSTSSLLTTTLHHHRPTSTSMDTTSYELVSNWTELPFKRHENKKRKNPFPDDSSRRTDPKRRVPVTSPPNAQADLKRGGLRSSGRVGDKQVKEEKNEQSSSIREVKSIPSIMSPFSQPTNTVQPNHYGSQFAPLTTPSHQILNYNTEPFKQFYFPKEMNSQQQTITKVKGPIESAV